MASQSDQVIPLEEMNRKLKMLKYLEGLGFAGALLLVIVAGFLITIDFPRISPEVILVLCLALILYVVGQMIVPSRRRKLECRWHETEGYVSLLKHYPGQAIFLTLSTSYQRVIVLQDDEETRMCLETANKNDLRVLLRQHLDLLTNRFYGEKVRTF